MITLLLAYAFSQQCRLDYYEPRLAPLHQGICQPSDERSPASIRKLDAKPVRSTKNPLLKYNKLEQRIYKALKRGTFNGIDLNGDGTKDIKISKNSKGQTQIAYSLRKNGKFNQFNVYNRQGILLSEKVDNDMDGQVDYIHECNDTALVCETKSNYQNGKANTLWRRTLVGSDYLYEMYERQNGSFVLRKKEKKPVQILQQEQKLPLNTEGEFCFECYDENASQFVRMLNNLKAIQDDYKSGHALTSDLPSLDDFRVSRSGVLIHNECFEPGRFNFDVEEAVVDGIVKTMAGLIELEERYLERYVARGEKTRESVGASEVLKSHVPRFLGIMDPSNWQNSNIFRHHYKSSPESNDLLIYPDASKGQSGEDPCRDWFDVGTSRCEFVSEVAPQRPKIYCEIDEWGSNSNAVHRQLEGHIAYTSTPQHPAGHVKIGSDGRIKMYNGPGITFVPEFTKDMSAARFQSTLTHELFHNMGYAEKSKDHNHYYYTCQAAIHYDTHADDLKGRVSLDTAARDCTGPHNPTTSPDTSRSIQIGITENIKN